ncbi:hypothetical protein CPB86DRAFT_786585, partial [Serendipita vermifera]
MGSWNQNLTHDHAYGTQNTVSGLHSTAIENQRTIVDDITHQANPSVPPASTPQSPGWVPWQLQPPSPQRSALSEV